MTERCELSDNDEAAKQSTTSLQINNWCENEDNSTLDNTKQGTEEANDIEYCLELIPNLNDDAHSLIIEGTSQTKHENRIENLAANNVGAIHIGDRIYVNGDAEFTGNIGGSIYQKRLRESLENRSDCTKKVRWKIILAVVILCIIAIVVIICPKNTTEVGFLVNRSLWNAENALNSTSIGEIKLIIASQAGGDFCYDFHNCSIRVAEIQKEDMKIHHFPDIRYNFLIGGDGRIYEGRGWDKRNEIKEDTIDVGFVGNYANTSLSDKMLTGLDNLIQEGSNLNRIRLEIVHVICSDQMIKSNVSMDVQLCKDIANFKYHSDISDDAGGDLIAFDQAEDENL
ncbi:peptidoglycan-recognition protein SC1a/b-like isoform X7 [Sitophilus oryzae]|uniref:Peptidoglycan-recognition protein SC1a/b-like isoform X7 n=1 Tax=Sitophilus oryzae TaxID=7048 RepID=A0A6J2YHM2_SITOR|nr:peptidoglycan-recognition protein SC1a/b-like isoform X7 [Sitophilus oryzae]